MESSNNIIHPTRLKVLAFGSSCFGRVMMSVRSILNGWVGTKLDGLPPQSKKNLDGYHRKMNPHHEAMVRLDYHGAQ